MLLTSGFKRVSFAPPTPGPLQTRGPLKTLMITAPLLLQHTVALIFTHKSPPPYFHIQGFQVDLPGQMGKLQIQCLKSFKVVV